MPSNVTIWLKGLLAAVIGGASSTFLLFVTAPTELKDFAVVWKVVLGGALIALAGYLKQSPIPKG